MSVWLRIAICALWCALVAGQTDRLLEPATYLVIAMNTETAAGDSFNQGSSNELGADRCVLSEADPSLYGVYQERFVQSPGEKLDDGVGKMCSGGRANPTGGGHLSPPGAKKVFQGIDWSGNAAITAPAADGGGKFQISDWHIFADVGFVAGGSVSRNVENTEWFQGGQLTSVGGKSPTDDPKSSSAISTGNGLTILGPQHLQVLRDNVAALRTFVTGLAVECEYQTGDLASDFQNINMKDNGKPLTGKQWRSSGKVSGMTTNSFDSCDKNGDKIAVIDIRVNGGQDFGF